MRSLCLLSLLATFAACDTVAVYPPEGAITVDGLSLSADRATYDNRSDVTLTLRNDSAVRGETGVLECALLQKRTEAGWTDAPDHNDRVCILILVVVEPGDSLTAEVELDGVPDGTYRLLQRVNGDDITTASFEIR